MNEPLRLDTSAQCEVLFELCSAVHGTAHVGRMLKGVETGRLVLLREPKLSLLRGARSAIDVARSVAHPAFNKLLGVVRSAQHEYIASEYVPGASLSEVSAVIRQRNDPLLPAVAVRLLLDALKAACIASELLADTAGVTRVRFIFPDTVWVAEYGDVLLMELGVAPLMTTGEEESAEAAASKDVYAAALELLQLASAQRISSTTIQSMGELVPAELAAVLRCALGVDGARSIATPLELARALAALPAHLIASDLAVEEDLQRVMGKVFEARRRKLELLTIGAASQYDEDTTQIFRASSLDDAGLDTARPPAPDTELPAVRFPPASGQGALAHSEVETTEASHVRAKPGEVATAATRPLEAAPRRLTSRTNKGGLGWYTLLLLALALALLIRSDFFAAAFR